MLIFRNAFLLYFLFNTISFAQTGWSWVELDTMSVRISNSAVDGEAQSDKPLIKRNGIFVGAGTSLFWLEANINYEILIFQSKKGTCAFGLQTGVGMYGAAFDGDGTVFNPKLVLLAGKNNKFFEFTAGANLFTDIDTYYWSSEFVPSGSLGFRTHTNDGRFFWRIGLGWPMGLFIGAGLRF